MYHRPSAPTYLRHLPPPTSSADAPPTTSALLRFYLPPYTGRDHRGRTLPQILLLPDRDLEFLHDWIQWLFPLPESSAYSPFAPILTFTDVCAFRTSADLRNALRRSFARVLEFLGFVVGSEGEGEGEGVVRTERWGRNAKFWWRARDHNHLRITRVLRSLRVLGLDWEAQVLWMALRRAKVELGERGAPGEVSYKFWRRAAVRRVWVAPEEGSDGEEEGGDGEEREEEETETLPDEEMTEVDEEWEGIVSEDERTEKDEDEDGDEDETDSDDEEADEEKAEAKAVVKKTPTQKTESKGEIRTWAKPEARSGRR
ncbi:opioid growth factor receptor conserved region-domain-containing protein [Tricharina praecox]|uniref:opioid growth factor receptor conserved region-domain-containing protein n=1 Tax=Tricharina praecox TaxID=43433 RepID=UPI002220F6EC|nr:opioid growth factor receptor conserved region-domain-containing protein [Tricharina praecox]KAI5858742.1 opioid growth factor receptor conserved region-domain-containing protein [Tricharina praecox]